MTNSQRVIVNTLAQYIRTIINVCLSLYSTRLILSALGQNDYGIYMLVAGVIAMLSFVTNALVTTTQRYLSVSHGKNDTQRVHQVFGNSMLLHLFIGCTLFLVLGICGNWITHDVLNIEADRQEAALWVYYCAGILIYSFLICHILYLRESFIDRWSHFSEISVGLTSLIYSEHTLSVLLCTDDQVIASRHVLASLIQVELQTCDALAGEFDLNLLLDILLREIDPIHLAA